MLKSAYGEECLSRTSVFEWHKRRIEAQNARMQKIADENNVDYIFYTKGIIHHEFVPEKLNVNFIKRLIVRVHRVRPEFQESVSWYLLHDNALAHSTGFVSEFLAKRGIPTLSHPPYSPDLAPADFFFYCLN
jgi:hypothetical protein